MSRPRSLAEASRAGALATVATLLVGCPVIEGPGGTAVYSEVQVGALAITEIMADPLSSRPEWIEVLNIDPDGDRVSLLGCTVRDFGASEHDITIGASINLEIGEYAILARADFLGATEDDLPADFNLGDDIVLDDGALDETVQLDCPDGEGGSQVVASVTYNWDAEAMVRGRSRQLAVDPAGPDAGIDPADWCGAPAQANALFYELGDDREYGTPRAATVCEEAGGGTPAKPGDVLITELLIGDASGVMREWVELHNPTTLPLDIRRCRLQDASIEDPNDINNHTLDYEAGDTVIEPGGYLLLSKTSTDIHYKGTTDDFNAGYAYSSLGFTNSELQSLSLTCLSSVPGEVVEIDWMLYDWEPFNDDFKGYSWSLSADALDHESNDDESSWCLADDADLIYTFTDTDDDPPTVFEAHGTPGAANPVCPAPPSRPRTGELVFTEMLIKTFTGLRQWFELHNPTAEPRTLLGCRLVKEEVDGTNPSIHDFETPRGETTVQPGEYFTLAKTGFDITPDGSVVADYKYTLGSSGTFLTSRAQNLRIECPGGTGYEVVDSITYDWRRYPDEADGTSVILTSDDLTTEGNDDPDKWCPAQPTDVYYEDGTVAPPRIAVGSPGAPNSACPIPDPYPLEGDLVITEIMGAPRFGDTEWFEIKNVGPVALRLEGCVLEDLDASPPPGTHTIDPSGSNTLSIGAGEYLVFVSNSADDAPASCALPWAYDYASIGFNNSGTETFSIQCPDGLGGLTIIDAVTYDGSDFESGIALNLSSANETAAANDASGSGAFCSPEPTAVTWPWSCTDPVGGSDVNYGSPGAGFACP